MASPFDFFATCAKGTEGALLPLPALAKAPATPFTEDGTYIVRMAAQPVVAYTGGIGPDRARRRYG